MTTNKQQTHCLRPERSDANTRSLSDSYTQTSGRSRTGAWNFCLIFVRTAETAAAAMSISTSPCEPAHFAFAALLSLLSSAAVCSPRVAWLRRWFCHLQDHFEQPPTGK